MDGERELSVKTYCQDDEVILSIVSYHKWGEGDRAHMALIVNVIKNHLKEFLSENIFEKYPQAKNKNRIIEIVHKFPLSTEAQNLFKLIKKGGFSYRCKHMEP